MLKFKFLLWVMTKLMQRAIASNAACAKYVAGKRLEFQIQTLDRIGRYFRVQDGTVGLPSTPGIGFEEKAALYSVMREVAAGHSPIVQPMFSICQTDLSGPLAEIALAVSAQ